MKRFVLVFICAIISAVCLNAQIYQPFIPGQSSSGGSISFTPPSRSYGGYGYQSAPQVQSFRATAYYVDSSNQLRKVPIRVNLTSTQGGITGQVVSEYQSTGFGGQWVSISTPANVQQCMPMASYGGTKALEQAFMFKALVNMKWYYFDL